MDLQSLAIIPVQMGIQEFRQNLDSRPPGDCVAIRESALMSCWGERSIFHFKAVTKTRFFAGVYPESCRRGSEWHYDTVSCAAV